MNAHVSPPANVLRFPPRLRQGSDNRRLSDPWSSSALDALLSAGTIDARQHAAGLRRRFDNSGGSMLSWRDTSGMSDEIGQAEVVQPVLQRDARDSDAEIRHVGEVGQPGAARLTERHSGESHPD